MTQTDFMSKKNSIGISVKINPCIIVENDIILVFEKRSTIAPMNSPQRIAGKYDVIATRPVILSEFVNSKLAITENTELVNP